MIVRVVEIVVFFSLIIWRFGRCFYWMIVVLFEGLVDVFVEWLFLFFVVFSLGGGLEEEVIGCG